MDRDQLIRRVEAMRAERGRMYDGELQALLAEVATALGDAPAAVGPARYGTPLGPYRLETFAELPPRIMGRDDRCNCAQTSYCPLGRTGAEDRCTLAELLRLDAEAVPRRARQSGEYERWP